MSTTKEKLAEELERVAGLMALAGENHFKVRAYERGAEALLKAAKTDSDLTAIAAGTVKVPGIGEGLRAAMAEFLKTGVIKAAVDLEAAVPAALWEFTKLPGLGAKKARVIHEELGINTLGELAYACQENRLLKLKGFGPSTQTKILENIERMKRNAGRFLMNEAHAMADALLGTFPVGWRAVKVGELGRSCEVVGRFEFAVHGASRKELEAFAKKQKSMENLHLEPIDVPFDELPALQRQRLMAPEKIRRRLDHVGKPLTTKEGALWESSWLEEEWEGRVPPRDAYRRSVHGAVKGVFHNHTNRSDGSATLEEMVHEAERLGLQYIGISDHSQTAFYAHGLKADELLEQHEEIKKLQKKVKVKIFHGVESDILADGALDYPKSILEKLDFVVGSIHSRFQMDPVAMTERLVKALAHPLLTFWGHPTGRLLLGRDAYRFDWDAVFKSAKKHGVVFELNANPQRLDLDWRMGARLVEQGIPLCINPDAHSVEGLSDTRWGEAMAEKAMVPADLVLNLRGVDDMEHWLRRRKRSGQ